MRLKTDRAVARRASSAADFGRVAVLLGGRATRIGGQVGVILSGGNVDLDQCPFLAGRA